MKTAILALPAPRVIGSKNIGPNKITLRRAADLRAKRLNWQPGEGYWAKQVAQELRANPGHYRVEIGNLGRANERVAGTIYRRPATSGKWGKSAATRLGGDLAPAITLSTHMATYVDLAGHDITHPAPKGMLFFADDNGVYLWRCADEMEYHPTAEDWTAKDFATRVRKAMDQNKRRRKAAARNEKIYARNSAKAKREQERQRKLFAQRVAEGIRVTIEDSRRAGNCVEGSLAFAEKKLGVPRAEILASSYLFSVSAARLISVANGNLPQVEAAIKIAWLRETTVSI